MNHREEAILEFERQQDEQRSFEQRDARQAKARLESKIDEQVSLAALRDTDGWATMEALLRQEIKTCREKMDTESELGTIRFHQGAIRGLKHAIALVTTARGNLERMREGLKELVSHGGSDGPS